jgi:hypothetical protein
MGRLLWVKRIGSLSKSQLIGAFAVESAVTIRPREVRNLYSQLGALCGSAARALLGAPPADSIQSK